MNGVAATCIASAYGNQYPFTVNRSRYFFGGMRGRWLTLNFEDANVIKFAPTLWSVNPATELFHRRLRHDAQVASLQP
jgi:hypothetical protein